MIEILASNVYSSKEKRFEEKGFYLVSGVVVEKTDTLQANGFYLKWQKLLMQKKRNLLSLSQCRLIIFYTSVLSHSVMSKSLRPHGLKPTRLLLPWEFFRQEYWSGLPCPSPGDLPNQGIKPRSPTLQAFIQLVLSKSKYLKVDHLKFLHIITFDMAFFQRKS